MANEKRKSRSKNVGFKSESRNIKHSENKIKQWFNNRKNDYLEKNCSYNKESGNVVEGRLTNGRVVIRRNIYSVGKSTAEKRIVSLVNCIQEWSCCGCVMSKYELYRQAVKSIEELPYVFKEDANVKKFEIKQICIKEELRLYILLALYPNFAYIKEVDSKLQYPDEFLEHYVLKIYEDFYDLCTAIIMDALLKAIYKKTVEKVGDAIEAGLELGEKGQELYKENFDMIVSMLEYRKKEESNNNKSRKTYKAELLEQFLPSIYFYMTIALGIKSDTKAEKLTRDIRNVKYVSDFLEFPIYRNKEMRKKQKDCLEDAYMNFYSEYEKLDSKPYIYKYLSLYHINLYAGVIDAYLMKENAKFRPSIINGVFTQIMLNRIMHNNMEYLKEWEKEKNKTRQSKEKIIYASMACNRNFVAKNISEFDLEFINYIIDRGAYMFGEKLFKGMSAGDFYKTIFRTDPGDDFGGLIDKHVTFIEPEWYKSPFEDIPKGSLKIDRCDYETCMNYKYFYKDDVENEERLLLLLETEKEKTSENTEKEKQ